MAIPSYLLVFDFDRTVADTFTPSPHGIGVTEAYKHALNAVFGEGVMPLYEELGGLGNRAPSELVQVIIQRDRNLIGKAMERIHPIPKSLAGKSAEIVLSEMLVRRKLDLLLREIGPLWPRPCIGYIELVKAVKSFSNEEILVETAIISSGHQSFIEKTMKVWNAPCPDIMVTDDNIRWRKHPEVHERVKPATFQLMLALRRWSGYVPGSNNRIIYFGDDPRKDGQLAVNAGIPFGWFKNEPFGGGETFSFLPGSFEFSDWSTVAEFLLAQKKEFQAGKSCTEIFQKFGREQV